MNKKISPKKIVVFFVVSIATVIGLYISWGIYQAENISVIPLEDIHNVSIFPDNVLTNETKVAGEADIGNFEEISEINKEKVDDVLYIIIHKQPSFSRKNTFSITLDNVKDINSITNISIISGEVYTGEGSQRGYSPIDFKNLPDKKIIWEPSSNWIIYLLRFALL